MKELIGVGVLGGGRIGRVHAANLASGILGVNFVGVADPAINKEMESYFDSLGVRLLGSLEDLVRDPEVSAILICGSTASHLEAIELAASRGKHIFCEKPIALELDHIHLALESVRKAGVKFQVGFNRRFDHNFAALRRAIQAGNLGDVTMIRLTSRDPAPPPVEYIATSGGIFLDMAIHDFDMIRFLSGSEVESVYATGGVLSSPEVGAAGDIDSAMITLTLSSGALGCIDLARKCSYGYDQRAEVLGSRGVGTTGNDTSSTAIVRTEEGVAEETPLHFFLERYRDAYATEIGSFLDAIREDRPTEVEGIDGLKPMEIALAAKRSLDTGECVQVSEFQR